MKPLRALLKKDGASELGVPFAARGFTTKTGATAASSGRVLCLNTASEACAPLPLGSLTVGLKARSELLRPTRPVAATFAGAAVPRVLLSPVRLPLDRRWQHEPLARQDHVRGDADLVPVEHPDPLDPFNDLQRAGAWSESPRAYRPQGVSGRDHRVRGSISARLVETFPGRLPGQTRPPGPSPTAPMPLSARVRVVGAPRTRRQRAHL